MILCCNFYKLKTECEAWGPTGKTSLLPLDVSQEYFRGCFRPSSWPDMGTDIQEESIIYKRSLATRKKKKIPPFHFNTKTWEESPHFGH